MSFEKAPRPPGSSAARNSLRSSAPPDRPPRRITHSPKQSKTSWERGSKILGTGHPWPLSQSDRSQFLARSALSASGGFRFARSRLLEQCGNPACGAGPNSSYRTTGDELSDRTPCPRWLPGPSHPPLLPAHPEPKRRPKNPFFAPNSKNFFRAQTIELKNLILTS